MTSENPTRQLHQQADAFLNGGRLLEARSLYEQICALDENDADAWLMKGAIDGETGKVTDAVSHVKKAIAIDPDYADAYHTLAHLLVSLGSIEEARDSLRKAVELDSEYTEAWMMLAGIQGQLQNYAEAEACSRQALQQDGALVEAHMSLGNALSSLGDNEGAMASYQTATRLQPNLQIAWSRLGAVQLQLNDVDGAMDALNRALSLDSNDVPAKVCMARILISREQLEEAAKQLQTILMAQPEIQEAWAALLVAGTRSGASDDWLAFCEQVTSLHPDSGQAWLGLGYVLEHRQARDQALESYLKAIELEPELHDAWTRKGVVYAMLERHDEALESFREALTRGSDAPVTHCGYGSMLRRRGFFEKSEHHCRIATEKAPDWSAAFCELGRVLVDQGRLDEAQSVYRQALDLDAHSEDGAAGLAQVFERMANPENAYEVIKPFLERGNMGSQIACVFGKLSAGIGRQEEALARIDETLKDKSLGIQQRIDLHFRAAEVLDGQKNHDRAIEHYNQANALKPVSFDARKHTGFINDLISIFDKDAPGRLPHVTIASDRPVFIVGMPRSGTSLVEQILACHDQVCGAGELMEIGRAAVEIGFRVDLSAPSVEQVESLPQDVLNGIAREYLTKLDTLSSGEARVTDKMPSNYMWLGLIQLLFPGARIIHVRRNSLDTCLSCYFTDFNGVHDYAYSLDGLGHYYCEYKRLMAHWKSVLSVPFLEVDYESLVANVEKVSRSMIEFCGLEWDPKVLDFHKSGRLANTTSYQQVRQPIYSSSVGRWKRYDEHLGLLRSVLADCEAG